MSIIRTVGHGTLEATALVELLRGAGVDAVVDVRRYPGSRRHSQFGSEAMAAWLGDAGITYEWLAALGGRRSMMPDSPHVGLRNEQFRAYADHMATAEFAAGLADLEATASTRSAAVLCAESLWWRCHRRLLADHLVLVEGETVEHLFHDGHLVRHEPTAEARRVDHAVVYDQLVQPPRFGP
jgi:uncharacterized protein (DUF488 family)